MKEKIWIVAAFVLTFTLGVLVGAIIVRHFGPPPFALLGESGRRHFSMRGEQPPIPSVGLMQKQLGLSETQQQQLTTIVENYRGKFQEHFRQVRPTMHALVSQMRGEIEAVLTPEQLEKFRRDFPHRERRSFSPRSSLRDSLPESPE